MLCFDGGVCRFHVCGVVTAPARPLPSPVSPAVPSRPQPSPAVPSHPQPSPADPPCVVLYLNAPYSRLPPRSVDKLFAVWTFETPLPPYFSGKKDARMAQRWPLASRPARDARTPCAPARGAPAVSTPEVPCPTRMSPHARSPCCLAHCAPRRQARDAGAGDGEVGDGEARVDDRVDRDRAGHRQNARARRAVPALHQPTAPYPIFDVPPPPPPMSFLVV